MRRSPERTRVGALACEVCGRLPHPRRARLTLAKLAAVFPVELALHALVVHYQLPYLLTVLALTASTTILIIWVVEPSAMRLLARWMHGPDLRHRDRLDQAAELWRIRVRIRDTPGQLQSLAKHLAYIRVNILTVHVHHLGYDVLNELVVATPAGTTARTLTDAVTRARGSTVGVWPATAVTLIDGQTKALTLAARVVSDSSELPLAIAELLGAHYILSPSAPDPAPDDSGTLLELTQPAGAPLRFHRSGEPFTPAEIARAHRLSDLAQILARRD
ncbi:amino acid-binding protein [Nocardia sp. NPDC051570]|uniref:amino acid-binding protein n=1 Tax=Nocardia sp. NPDC051570 TaxID=3364324 RepID=UPI00378C3B1D